MFNVIQAISLGFDTHRGIEVWDNIIGMNVCKGMRIRQYSSVCASVVVQILCEGLL